MRQARTILALLAAVWEVQAADVVFSRDYSKPGLAYSGQLAVDGKGGVYRKDTSGEATKYNSDGEPVWRASFGFVADAFAADTDGNLFGVGLEDTTGRLFVGRINADGTANSARIYLGTGLALKHLTVDPRNRLWVTGTANKATLAATAGAFQSTPPYGDPSHGFLLRLNAAGTAIEYATYIWGGSDDSPSAVAVDPTGAAYVLGMTQSQNFPLTSGRVSGPTPFLLKLKPDGTGLVYSIALTGGATPGQLVVDASGEATATLSDPIAGSRLVHYRADGTVAFTRDGVGDRLAVDAAGNVYAAGPGVRGNHLVKNTTATCGLSFLNIYSSAGDWLQGTWLPTDAGSINAMAVSGQLVYLEGTDVISAPPGILTRLSQKLTFARETLALGCVTDAAIFRIPGLPQAAAGSYPKLPSGISPGELVSLFGIGLGPTKGTQPDAAPLPKELAGVRVTFDGVDAPLLYVQDAQINAIVPWAVATGKDTQVCVVFQAVRTNCISVPVVTASPAVFTRDGNYALAINQDGSINDADHPAPLGSVVTLWATGLGPIRPAVEDGAVVSDPASTNLLPVTASSFYNLFHVGTVTTPWDVLYYGPAPGMAAGVSQINLRVPLTDSFGQSARSVYLLVDNVGSPFTLFARP